MLRIIPVLVLAVVIGVMSSFNTLAEDSLGVSEFRKLYDSLLSGKTLVNESQQDGVVVKKEKIYGKAVDTGDGDFDIPVSQVITYTQDGEMEWKVQVNIIDRVNDLGGRAIIQEEITGISVLEHGDEKPEESNGIEFGGIYRVGKNAQGGFDVHNFSLTPSLLIEGENLSLAGSMITYSCSVQDAKTVCNYTVRDFELGDYEPYKGYKIGKPIGGDFTETFVSK
ncbi:MAG: hypothetical protein O7C70_00605 [Candidatus Dadabacteria bacterium]|jgi:hypothetical protein|nr:hypothetical protein [Candidatus Dadabacteria bacterium]